MAIVLKDHCDDCHRSKPFPLGDSGIHTSLPPEIRYAPLDGEEDGREDQTLSKYSGFCSRWTA